MYRIALTCALLCQFCHWEAAGGGGEAGRGDVGLLVSAHYLHPVVNWLPCELPYLLGNGPQLLNGRGVCAFCLCWQCQFTI